MNSNTTNDGIERLLKDPKIKEVIYAKVWELHPIDVSLFREERDYAKDYIQDLQDFLRAPYIIDRFSDHAIRSSWKHVDVPRDYGKGAEDFLQSNALRALVHGIVPACIDTINLENYVGPNPNEFRQKHLEMTQSYDKIFQLYSEITRDNGDVISSPPESIPMDLVEEMKVKVYALLEFLSEQSPAP